MTEDTRKALVQRLRSNRPIPTLPHEAANRIEALSAENERLRSRIERLRKALYAAYDDEPGWCDLTRAALGDTK